MRKTTRIVTLLSIVGTILSGSVAAPAAAPAASAPAESAATGMTEVGAGEGQVNIVAWAGYIERGETDPAYDWVTGFEKETGCKVNVKTAATSDEMVSLMNEGGFDLVTASGDASLRLIAGGTVQEVNVDLIPSFKTVDERLQNAAWNAMEWFEVVGTRYCDQLPPEQFMYSMLTRSQRISHENLRLRDAAWLDGYEAWLSGGKVVPPMLLPL